MATPGIGSHPRPPPGRLSITATTALWSHLKMDPSILAPRPAAAPKWRETYFPNLQNGKPTPCWLLQILEVSLPPLPQLDPPVFTSPAGYSIWIMAAAIPQRRELE